MYEELLATFGSKNLKPIYFLSGVEDYMIDSLIKKVELEFISPEEKDFNQQVYYGKETSIQQVVEACRQRPFIGDTKLVLLKEAQEIKNWEDILNYIKNPSSCSVLIIAYKNKKPDGRSNWVKALKEKAIYFESKSLSDNQLPAFIKSLASKHILNLDQEAISLMAEYLGNNLTHIENEISKIKLISSGKEKITSKLISDYIGISKEHNVFELCKSLSLKDMGKTYIIMENISHNMKSNPLLPMISSLFNHFQKIYLTKYFSKKTDQELATILKLTFASYIKEYREAASKYSVESLQLNFSTLKEFDLRSKGVNSSNVSQNELFKEMVLKICLN
ncbi:MAG: DNA polymerase III subunit delta [Saprospiraceae bacterium]